MKSIQFIVLIILSSIINGCGIGSSVYGFEKPGNGAIPNANIGYNSVSLNELHKEINLTITTTDSRFSIGQAYLGRFTNTSISAGFMIPVTNTSDADLCQISLNGGNSYDAEGNLIISLSSQVHLVYGSVRRLDSNSRFINSCLAQGESGYFLGSVSQFEVLAGLVFDSITVGTDTFTSPNAIVETTGNYVVNYGDLSLSSGQTLSIELVNRSSTNALLFAYNFWSNDDVNYFRVVVFLDENDRPLAWSGSLFYDIFMHETQVSIMAGESVYVTSYEFEYRGGASKIRFFYLYGDLFTP